MRKDNLIIFNSLTNIFILILLFFGGLSYADTNGIWQFANDTRPGVFGFDEGAGVTNNYTFINPVYFNLGLHSTALSTFTDLRTNLFNTNSAIITGKLTVTNNAGIAISANSTTGDGLITTTSATGKSAISSWTINPNSYSGFFDGNFKINSGNLIVNSVKNCGLNSKLRTDAFGNVLCGVDNVNDADFVIGNEYPLAGAGITITPPRTVNANDISPSNEIQVLSKIGNIISLSLGGGSVIDSNTDTWLTTQTCPAGQVLKSVGKNSKICVVDAQGVTVETDPTVPAYVKDGTSWAEVSGKPAGFADNVDNIGIVTQTCPAGQVLRAVGTNSKTCVILPTTGITTETDPQVGTLTNGKWCTSNGVTINCNSAAPGGGGPGRIIGSVAFDQPVYGRGGHVGHCIGQIGVARCTVAGANAVVPYCLNGIKLYISNYLLCIS